MKPYDARPKPSFHAALHLRRFLADRPTVMLCGLLILLVAGIAVGRPGTVNPRWLSEVVLFAAPLGILAAGQTLVMLTGGIDLSVANVVTAAAYVVASQSSYGVARAVLLALAVGVAVGIVNGVGIAVLRVQPLIMTLGMGLVVSGVLLVYSLSAARGGPPAVPPLVRLVGSSTLLGLIPVSLIVWALIGFVLIVGLRRTGFGRLLYGIGDNPYACRLAGVRTWLVQLITFTACGLLSALAGLLLVGATNAADLSIGQPYLLPSIAAVVIGGTSIYGGSGGYAGTIVGSLILTVLTSVFTLLSIPDPAKQILYGLIVLLLAALYTRAVSDEA